MSPSSYIAVNLDQNDENSPTPTEVEVCLGNIPSGELTHPTCGKGNTSTQKYPWDGDMLVPRRALHTTTTVSMCFQNFICCPKQRNPGFQDSRISTSKRIILNNSLTFWRSHKMDIYRKENTCRSKKHDACIFNCFQKGRTGDTSGKNNSVASGCLSNDSLRIITYEAQSKSISV